MGVVFSTLGTALSWLGALTETICLAIGEIASVLVRGVFTILVGLCDVLAAASCCWRRPWQDRPARGQYDGDYATMLNVGGQQVLKNLAQQPVLSKNEEVDAKAVNDEGKDGRASADLEPVTPTKKRTKPFAFFKRSSKQVAPTKTG